MFFLILSNAKAYVTIGCFFIELGFHPAIKGKASDFCSVNFDILVFRIFQQVFVAICFLLERVGKFRFAL